MCVPGIAEIGWHRDAEARGVLNGTNFGGDTFITGTGIKVICPHES